MSEEKNNQQPNEAKNHNIAQESEAQQAAEQNSQKSAEQNQEQSPEQVLQQKIAELEENLSKTNDQLLRTMADLENTRRRSREELEKSSKYAISNFVSELVLPIETFFLVCDNAPKEQLEKSPEVKNYADAVDMTRKELTKILEKNQVRRIFPLDEKFDHNFHEAVVHLESDKEKDIVAQVVQAGYTIGDRLIRPALVGVSKGKA